MTVNHYDATDGHPIFDDLDAPDIKVDPTAAALYAAEVGNRIVKTNLAALDAYGYKRAGLSGRALATNAEYVHTGTAWRPVTPGLVLLQRIDFATAASVSFTGFGAFFEDYLAILEINSSSVASGGTLRMRSGGADNTAAEYAAQQHVANGTSSTAAFNSGLTSFPMVPLTGAEHSMRIDFSRPAVVAPTRISVEAQTWTAPTAGWKSSLAGRHNVSAGFDGFTYVPSAGNITGSLTVYGRS